MANTKKTSKTVKNADYKSKTEFDKKKVGVAKEKIPFDGDKFKADIYARGMSLQSLCGFCKVSKTIFSVACKDNEIMPSTLKKACDGLGLNIEDYYLPDPISDSDMNNNKSREITFDQDALFARMDSSNTLIKEQNRLLLAQNEILKESLRVQQQYLKSLVELAENIYDDTTKIRSYNNHTAVKVRQLVEELTGPGNSCAEKSTDIVSDTDKNDESRNVNKNIEKAKDYIDVVLKRNNALYENNAKKFMENEAISELEFAAAAKELGVIKTFTGYGKNRKQMYVYSRERAVK